MELILKNEVRHILVLGAGASVDYGLPIWTDLGSLIREKINKDTGSRYKYKKEILAWIDMVGRGRKYDTIDSCIKEESVLYHSNGHRIEDQVFLVIKDIFDEAYKENDNGWIKILNEKILRGNEGNLEDKIAFIDCNYDYVLDKNLFNFTYLSEKEKTLLHDQRLSVLSRKLVKALYPHGYFPLGQELEGYSHVEKHSNTIKSGKDEFIDVVSCHESKKHNVMKYIQTDIALYVLGLGGGLKVNLNNIYFSSTVSEIHITIKDPGIKTETIAFLSKKYGIPATEIKVYSSCEELVKACFNN